MKEKSIVTKILIAGIFVVFLLLFLIVFSLIKMIAPKKEKVIEKSIISQTYSLVDIENISFDFKKSASTFLVGEWEELVIVQNSMEEKFYLNSKQKKNAISFEEDNYLINPQKKEYIVYLPKNYLNKLTIKNGFGEISIEGIINDIEMNNNSGKISLNTVGNINIQDVSGDISLKNVQGIINVSTSTGDIVAESVLGIINAETITGDILISDFHILGETSFENVSGDIVLQINPESLCKINYSNDSGKTIIDDNICNSEFNMITIKNITGMIKIN